MEGMSISLAIIVSVCSAIMTIAGAATILNRLIKSTIQKYSKEAIEASIKTVLETTDKSITDLCNNFNDSMKSLRESTNATMKDLTNKFENNLDELKTKIDTYIKDGRDNDEVFRESLMSLIRDRINQAHSYYMNVGKIDRHALYILEDMFNVYDKKLHGNSFVEDLMADLRKLEKQ